MRWFVVPQALPIVKQLPTMAGGPLEHHPQGAAWETPSQHRQWINPNRYFTPAVDRMKVRRVMIIIVHPNRDSEETANLRHRFSAARGCTLHTGTSPVFHCLTTANDIDSSRVAPTAH